MALGIPAVGVDLFDALALGQDRDMVLCLKAPRDSFYIQSRAGAEVSDITTWTPGNDLTFPSGAIRIGENADILAPHSTSVVPTLAPSHPPITISLESQILGLLPTPTVLDIQRDNSTAQSRAFQWLLSDPAVVDYSEHRLIQRFALATFYFSTSGEGWYNNTHWLSHSHHECDWFLGGTTLFDRASVLYQLFQFLSTNTINKPCVTADGNKTEVYQQLSLFNNGLRGSIPRELFLLSGITSLELFGNDLKGSMPMEFTKATRLTSLAMMFNDISGMLPTEIGLLPELKSISVGYNPIGGKIPSQLGLLAKNERFDEMVDDYHLMDCFECGSCSYVCPSHIPLVQQFRFAKAAVRKAKAAS